MLVDSDPMAAPESRLDQQSESELRAAADLGWKRCHYPATRFWQMLDEHGGVETAKRLLDDPNHVQTGLMDLWDYGKMSSFTRALDYTVESIVWKTEYQGLFTAGELDVAKQRLLRLEHRPRWVDW
jgi:hypothetical protein